VIELGKGTGGTPGRRHQLDPRFYFNRSPVRREAGALHFSCGISFWLLGRLGRNKGRASRFRTPHPAEKAAKEGLLGKDRPLTGVANPDLEPQKKLARKSVPEGALFFVTPFGGQEPNPAYSFIQMKLVGLVGSQLVVMQECRG